MTSTSATGPTGPTGPMSLSRLGEAVRLTPSFDAERLTPELAAVTSHRWQQQRIHAPGGGTGAATPIDWRVLPLRSPGGDAARTDPGGPGPHDFAATMWLERLPYLHEIIASIPAPLNAVRLMALGPGAEAHRDPKYAMHRGLARLHLPIVTHRDAVLILDGVRHCWAPGQLWYGDFPGEHLVRNTGPLTRVHVVIDVLITEALTGWFPPDWQAAFADGDVLLNRAATAVPPPLTGDVPATVLLPQGFTDFDHDESLDGDLQPAQLTVQDAALTLTTASRKLALTPAGPGEYRFVGWSEQRTLEPTSDAVTLRRRRGRERHERRVATP
jgi:aspartate beta-hydroxylase